MRIHLSTSWVLLSAILSIVAAEDQPNFLFDGSTFRGEMFETQSSVFRYENISQGTVFRWNQTGIAVDIVRVDLMNDNDQSIFSWCSDHTCDTTKGFDVQVKYPASEINLNRDVVQTLRGYLDEVLFFRVDWQYINGKRDVDAQRFSVYSQEWAVVDGDDAGTMYTANAPQMTAGAGAARPSGTAPATVTSATTSAGSYGTTASTTSVQTTPSAAAATGKSGTKSRALTTGAIVGIVVGCVGGVILVSVVAGCLCFRRRRVAGDERGGSRGVQDIAAEKEARASILDKDQPDTPYSEQNSQHPLHRGLGLAGRSESGVDLGIGQAISGERNESVRTESLHTVTVGNDRNSAVYSSLGGGANSAHGTPVIGSGAFASGHSSPRAQTHTPSMSVHDRSSAMGSPVPRASSQLDRSLSPYRDNAGQHEYGQHHHHVVNGADLVQQEHSNDSTARSPSSLYSNPLDELQPISPESARENDGAAGGGGGGGGGGVASSQPPGHGRANTPSGIAQQYAHLVEEGMTNDEIRRLEEEERALDEAIEAQVGTSGRQR